MFKVNNKDIRVKSVASNMFHTIFTYFRGVFMIDFEQVNVGWILAQQNPHVTAHNLLS